MVTSAAAYTSIKAALAHERSRVRAMNPEIYLQGSYGNSTNIYADSDVDVVVQYNSAWYPDVSKLPAAQQQVYQSAYSNSAYVWKQFQADVIESLRAYYGVAAVVPGNKAIKVRVPNGRTVDVVPAFQFRQYSLFQSPAVELHIEGVRFEDKSGRVVVNYPKLHIENGEAKNGQARTSGRYKQTVRMFKNARNCAIERRILAADAAPSYFIECVLYNVPDTYFSGARQVTFSGIVDYLNSTLQVDGAVCQNGQIKLFGNAAEQWDVAKGAALVSALISLWNNW